MFNCPWASANLVFTIENSQLEITNGRSKLGFSFVLRKSYFVLPPCCILVLPADSAPLPCLHLLNACAIRSLLSFSRYYCR
jgi:hypothetical protein